MASLTISNYELGIVFLPDVIRHRYLILPQLATPQYFNMIDNSSLDLILGIVALVILVAGLVMLFQGVNTMNK